MEQRENKTEVQQIEKEQKAQVLQEQQSQHCQIQEQQQQKLQEGGIITKMHQQQHSQEQHQQQIEQYKQQHQQKQQQHKQQKDRIDSKGQLKQEKINQQTQIHEHQQQVEDEYQQEQKQRQQEKQQVQQVNQQQQYNQINQNLQSMQVQPIQLPSPKKIIFHQYQQQQYQQKHSNGRDQQHQMGQKEQMIRQFFVQNSKLVEEIQIDQQQEQIQIDQQQEQIQIDQLQNRGEEIQVVQQQQQQQQEDIQIDQQLEKEQLEIEQQGEQLQSVKQKQGKLQQQQIRLQQQQLQKASKSGQHQNHIQDIQTNCIESVITQIRGLTEKDGDQVQLRKQPQQREQSSELTCQQQKQQEQSQHQVYYQQEKYEQQESLTGLVKEQPLKQPTKNDEFEQPKQHYEFEQPKQPNQQQKAQQQEQFESNQQQKDIEQNKDNCSDYVSQLHSQQKRIGSSQEHKQIEQENNQNQNEDKIINIQIESKEEQEASSPINDILYLVKEKQQLQQTIYQNSQGMGMMELKVVEQQNTNGQKGAGFNQLEKKKQQQIEHLEQDQKQHQQQNQQQQQQKKQQQQPQQPYQQLVGNHQLKLRQQQQADEIEYGNLAAITTSQSISITYQYDIGNDDNDGTIQKQQLSQQQLQQQKQQLQLQHYQQQQRQQQLQLSQTHPEKQQREIIHQESRLNSNQQKQQIPRLDSIQVKQSVQMNDLVQLNQLEQDNQLGQLIQSVEFQTQSLQTKQSIQLQLQLQSLQLKQSLQFQLQLQMAQSQHHQQQPQQIPDQHQQSLNNKQQYYQQKQQQQQQTIVKSLEYIPIPEQIITKQSLQLQISTHCLNTNNIQQPQLLTNLSSSSPDPINIQTQNTHENHNEDESDHYGNDNQHNDSLRDTIINMLDTNDNQHPSQTQQQQLQQSNNRRNSNQQAYQTKIINQRDQKPNQPTYKLEHASPSIVDNQHRAYKREVVDYSSVKRWQFDQQQSIVNSAGLISQQQNHTLIATTTEFDTGLPLDIKQKSTCNQKQPLQHQQLHSLTSRDSSDSQDQKDLQDLQQSQWKNSGRDTIIDVLADQMAESKIITQQSQKTHILSIKQLQICYHHQFQQGQSEKINTSSTDHSNVAKQANITQNISSNKRQQSFSSLLNKPSERYRKFMQDHSVFNICGDQLKANNTQHTQSIVKNQDNNRQPEVFSHLITESKVHQTNIQPKKQPINSEPRALSIDEFKKKFQVKTYTLSSKSYLLSSDTNGGQISRPTNSAIDGIKNVNMKSNMSGNIISIRPTESRLLGKSTHQNTQHEQALTTHDQQPKIPLQFHQQSAINIALQKVPQSQNTEPTVVNNRETSMIMINQAKAVSISDTNKSNLSLLPSQSLSVCEDRQLQNCQIHHKQYYKAKGDQNQQQQLKKQLSIRPLMPDNLPVQQQQQIDKQPILHIKSIEPSQLSNNQDAPHVHQQPNDQSNCQSPELQNLVMSSNTLDHNVSSVLSELRPLENPFPHYLQQQQTTKRRFQQNNYSQQQKLVTENNRHFNFFYSYSASAGQKPTSIPIMRQHKNQIITQDQEQPIQKKQSSQKLSQLSNQLQRQKLNQVSHNQPQKLSSPLLHIQNTSSKIAIQILSKSNQKPYINQIKTTQTKSINNRIVQKQSHIFSQSNNNDSPNSKQKSFQSTAFKPKAESRYVIPPKVLNNRLSFIFQTGSKGRASDYAQQKQPSQNNNNQQSYPRTPKTLFTFTSPLYTKANPQNIPTLQLTKSKQKSLQLTESKKKYQHTSSKNQYILIEQPLQTTSRQLNKPKKQKICLTLKKDFIQNHLQQNISKGKSPLKIQHNQIYQNQRKQQRNSSTSRCRKLHGTFSATKKNQFQDNTFDNKAKKLKQVKLTRSPKLTVNDSPSFQGKQYQEKKFQMIQKYTPNQITVNYQQKINEMKQQKGGQMVNQTQPFRNKIYSFIDRPSIQNQVFSHNKSVHKMEKEKGKIKVSNQRQQSGLRSPTFYETGKRQQNIRIQNSKPKTVERNPNILKLQQQTQKGPQLWQQFKGLIKGKLGNNSKIAIIPKNQWIYRQNLNSNNQQEGLSDVESENVAYRN